MNVNFVEFDLPQIGRTAIWHRNDREVLSVLDLESVYLFEASKGGYTIPLYERLRKVVHFKARKVIFT